MTDSFKHLSQGELLQLGLAAMHADEDAKAVVLLREAADRADASAQVLFLLGSQYAHVGLVDAAAEMLGRAVDLDPAFEVARFQLGLLQLSRGLAEEALAALAPLADSDPAGPYPHWQGAMSHLVHDEFADALAGFQRGLAVSSSLSNPALVRDIEMLAGRVQEAMDRAGGAQAPATAPEAADSPAGDAGLSHLFLNAYTKGRPH